MRRIILIGLFISVPVLGAWAQSEDDLLAVRGLVLEGSCSEAVTQLEALEPRALTQEGAYLLGTCYQAMLQHQKAAAAFNQADTSRVKVLADWGRSLERIGRMEEAELRYRSAYHKDSTNQTVAANLARLLADKGDWGDVVAIYNRLLAEDDANSFIYAQLGTSYARLDSIEQAIIHYEQAHALNNSNIKVVLALTKIYHDIDYFTSAKRVLDRALDERPRNPDLWRRTGEIALKEEDYNTSLQAFNNVLTYGDSTAADLRNVGVSRYLLGNFPSAAEALEASFERDTTDVMNTFYLGIAKQQIEAFDEALYYLNHAAQTLGQVMLADIHSRIAGTQEEVGNYSEAISSYRLASNLDANRRDFLYRIAFLYDQYYADKSAAQEQYQRFLDVTEEGQLSVMRISAEQRIQAIREARFFEQGRTDPSVLDTITIQPDTASSQER